MSLWCVDPSFSAVIVRELVDEVATDDDRARFVQFAIRSFVDESSGGRLMWCPGRGCACTVEFLGCDGGGDDNVGAL